MNELVTPQFWGLASMVQQTVAESSRRVYADTYKAWEVTDTKQVLD